ncbi:hypothetical protein [Rhodococcus qingshengii]|uniref:Uncharacterized protein n=1 Tax=Rhodococcus qingshengii TaxID=334542 RepID=A0A2A5JER1_RHOSG|nr:hypothetical protein [Rhodococcus qingshengii]PCK27856.1 hypothetical protein CHR55_10255 [Rhodococcus qingshengii]
MNIPYVTDRIGDPIESTTTILRRVGDHAAVMWVRDDDREEAYIPHAPRRRRTRIDEIMDKRRRESELRAAELQKLTCPRRGAR